MRRIGGLLTVLVVLGSATGIEAGAREEVTQAAQQWSEAWHAGNVDAITAFYAEDAQMFSALGSFRLDGRPSIQANWTGFFGSFPTRRLVLRHESIQSYGATAATWTGYYQVMATDRGGKTATLLGRYSSAWVKQDGRWVIVQQHISSMPPTP